MEALLLLVSEFSVDAEHDLEEAGEVLFGEYVGDASDASAFVVGNLEQLGIRAAYLCDQSIAEKADHLAGKVGRIMALGEEAVHLAKNVVAGITGDGVHH